MKRKSVFAVIMAAVMIIGLAACGSSGTSLKMATGGTTGTYYAYGGVIAGVLQDNVKGLSVKVHDSGASKSNIKELVSGDADLALVQNDVTYYSYNGTDLFESDGAQEGYSVIAGLYPEVVQIVSTPDITDISQLKGKRVSVGDAGSGTEFNARQILEAYDMTFDDIELSNLSFGDSATALKDAKIDAFFCVAGAPTNNIVDLCTNTKINILSVDDEHVAKLQSSYDFYNTYTIEAGTYSGVDADADCVAVIATLLVRNDVSKDDVYNITKTLFECKDQIGHEKASWLDPQYAVTGFDSMPIHPGALKYYTEIGVK